MASKDLYLPGCEIVARHTLAMLTLDLPSDSWEQVTGYLVFGWPLEIEHFTEREPVLTLCPSDSENPFRVPYSPIDKWLERRGKKQQAIAGLVRKREQSLGPEELAGWFYPEPILALTFAGESTDSLLTKLRQVVKIYDLPTADSIIMGDSDGTCKIYFESKAWTDDELAQLTGALKAMPGGGEIILGKYHTSRV